MRAFAALCLLLVGAAALPVPGLARGAPSYARPWVPPRSDPGLAKKAESGALALLRANCNLNDAQSALISGDVDKANELISEAVTEYFSGAGSFLSVSKSKDTDAALHAPSRSEVETAFRSLERYKISAPETYHDAYASLSGWITSETERINGVRFKGERSDVEILRRLISVQGGIAEIFLDITTLTVFAST